MIAKKTHLEEKRYSSNPNEREGDKKKYYPKPGKEKENKPVYSPDIDKEKGKRNYREFKKESKLAYSTEPNLNLERRTGEKPEDYHHRLTAIYSTQVGVISKYEREKELDRYRTTDKEFGRLLEEGTERDEEAVKKLILNLQKDVNFYSQNYPNLLSRKSILEKLRDLELLL